MAERPSVYDLFIVEVERLRIPASRPAVAVVGDMTRAVKRAQMQFDKAVSEPEARDAD